jgi:citrate synthase
MRTPTSKLCHYTAESVYYGSENLVTALIGKASFIDVFVQQTFGRLPSGAEVRLINAVLVTLMEHGLTPSAIAARMVYSSSPENLQAGVAAGLLAVASRFVGTMEDTAVLLTTIADSEDPALTAKRIAQDYRGRRVPVPGFGHHLHKPDDPRTVVLLDLAAELGLSGRFAQALWLLASEVDAAASRHITINATGAIAAVLGDIQVPVPLMRGFAVLARTAGLISHIAEEQREPSGRFIWDLVDTTMTPAKEEDSD